MTSPKSAIKFQGLNDDLTRCSAWSKDKNRHCRRAVASNDQNLRRLLLQSLSTRDCALRALRRSWWTSISVKVGIAKGERVRFGVQRVSRFCKCAFQWRQERMDHCPRHIQARRVEWRYHPTIRVDMQLDIEKSTVHQRPKIKQFHGHHQILPLLWLTVVQNSWDRKAQDDRPAPLARQFQIT